MYLQMNRAGKKHTLRGYRETPADPSFFIFRKLLRKENSRQFLRIGIDDIFHTIQVAIIAERHESQFVIAGIRGMTFYFQIPYRV